MALRTFLFFVLVFLAPYAYAQDKDVQVNLEVLEHYAPPPMFGVLEKDPVAAAPKAKRAPAARELQEKDIVQPTAAEILKTIEAMENKRRKVPVKDAPSKDRYYTGKMDQSDKPMRVRAVDGEGARIERVEAEKVPAMVEPEPEYNLSVPLEGAKAMDLPQVREILLPRLIRAQDSRLEIRSFARGDAAKAGDARRQSLSQALEVKKFLVAQGVDARRIDILPLGDEEGDIKQGRFDFKVRPL